MTNVVLGLVAAALLATTVFFWNEETPEAPYGAVSAAARAQTKAFLTVDYQDMDPLIEKVLDGATGTFKAEYEQGKANLKASAQQSQAVSTGEVLSVGINDIDEDNAVVLVAADSEVSNKSTQGKAQPRYYRLELTMVRKGERWLTSNLQFVG